MARTTTKSNSTSSKSTNKSDTSAYWSSVSGGGSSSASNNKSSQPASRTKNSPSNKGNKNNNNSNGSNNASSVDAEKNARIEAYELMRKGLSDANTELTLASSGINSFMDALGKFFSGNKAKEIQNKVRGILDDINTIGEKVNGYLNNITQKEVELGGNPNPSNNNKYQSKDTLVTPIDAGIYACDIDEAQNALVALDYIKKSLNNAKDKISNLPKNVSGSEGINNVTSQINDTGTNVAGASRTVQKTIDDAKSVEKENANILDNIGKLLSDAWDTATDWAEDAWDAATDFVEDAWDATTDFVEEAWDNTKEWVSDTVEDVKDALNSDNTDKNNNWFVLEASAAEIDASQPPTTPTTPSTPSTPQTPNKPENQKTNFEEVSITVELSDEEIRRIKEALINGQTVTTDIFAGETSRVVVTKDGKVRVYAPGVYGLGEDVYVDYTADEFFNDILPQSNYNVDTSQPRRTSF